MSKFLNKTGGWRLHNDAAADIESTAVLKAATSKRGCHTLLTDDQLAGFSLYEFCMLQNDYY
jgi:hypothetical protein